MNDSLCLPGRTGRVVGLLDWVAGGLTTEVKWADGAVGRVLLVSVLFSDGPCDKVVGTFLGDGVVTTERDSM